MDVKMNMRNLIGSWGIEDNKLNSNKEYCQQKGNKHRKLI